jgi:hypothetical protein
VGGGKKRGMVLSKDRGRMAARLPEVRSADMTWCDEPIPNDPDGHPMFKGLIRLKNDKNEILGGICWFYDQGPFYASAMDAADTSLIRRIGPCTTLDGAKRVIFDAIEGRLDISKRAGYPR